LESRRQPIIEEREVKRRAGRSRIGEGMQGIFLENEEDAERELRGSRIAGDGARRQLRVEDRED
jgi:hypothetical protein